MKDEGLFPMADGPAMPWAAAEAIYPAWCSLYGKRHTLEELAPMKLWTWREVEFFLTEAYRIGWRPS